MQNLCLEECKQIKTIKIMESDKVATVASGRGTLP